MEIKKISIEELARMCAENLIAFFRISRHEDDRENEEEMDQEIRNDFAECKTLDNIRSTFDSYGYSLEEANNIIIKFFVNESSN